MSKRKQDDLRKYNINDANPVRIVRKQLGLKQAELAERLNVEPNYISMLETGRRRISKNVAVDLQRVSPPGTRLEWILGYKQYQTEAEEVAAMDAIADAKYIASLPELQKHGEAQMMIIKKAAQTAGFNYEIRKNGKTPCYCFIDANGAETELTVDSMFELISDITDYAAFRVKRTINKEHNKSQLNIEM